MKVVMQRVSKAVVNIENRSQATIHKGLCILLGVAEDDTEQDAEYLIRKILNKRIFSDEDQKMNLSLLDIHGEILIISQFTLYAKTKKGNRPSFTDAASPNDAETLYEYFVSAFKRHQNEGKIKKVATGAFGADMKVSLTNDGPVTIIVESKDRR
jgi:D-tyrosyl-tRNA(Tyr) deacylase